MRYRIMLVVVSLLAALAVPLLSGSSEAATSAIRFTYVQYDSPGKDDGSNASLNAEWIRIKNFGTTKKNLAGWTVKDKAGHTYKFGTYYLGAGKTVRIHTGKGTNTSTDRYWGRTAYVWNNTGDKAYLRNASGTLKDTCEWGDGPGYKYC